ncbi:2'-5' RNA ligase family protein [Streptomyces sp. XM4193]|uniref:2'-5' RNA ligase family protein n=1 Tax=Streptomyces sp. XM4193 TaxID=2929782 RepID=UPI001FF7D494|nr:2'-5' RNA ligase family protein [Streptomyces sp. XM4193]MCK1795350.1 2'-5' RNA ligase family protein [Streptomyces sp. XM4193]
MRLFAAIELPEPVREELRLRTAALRTLPGADRLRWSAPADLHCTLAFHGPVPERLATGLCRELGRSAARQRPFEVWLDGGGHFGDAVLWAGVGSEPAAPGRPAAPVSPAPPTAPPPWPSAPSRPAPPIALAALAAAAAGAGRAAGVPADDRLPFVPHVTLARGRPAEVPLLPWVDELRSLRTRPWRVTEVVLLRSLPQRPDRAGAQSRQEQQPRYERWARFGLGSPPGG